ncbi:MAG: hypothetical protein O3C21_19845 [Verrucomicrobia bacterium]|nr:hypothetical protein [Verrucomicrobiota bacterium]
MKPLDFLYHLRDLMREEEIRFAITSGMACVYYGLQQNTKDSDWIVHPEDIGTLRALLEKKQRHVPPWRISYRGIFGAPLEARYLEAGWTSHLSIWPDAGGPEEHVDIFGTPPRVSGSGLDADDEGFATRQTVALMKRTDRDKDWPIVDGLGWQFAAANDYRQAVLHIQNAPRLIELWAEIPAAERRAVQTMRPLLGLIQQSIDPLELSGWIRLERLLWELVNRERYGIYQRAWKEFFKKWRTEDDWIWPTAEPFEDQHRRVLNAADRHSLPVNPMDGIDPQSLVDTAARNAAKAGLTSAENVERVLPPTSVLFP